MKVRFYSSLSPAGPLRSVAARRLMVLMVMLMVMFMVMMVCHQDRTSSARCCWGWCWLCTGRHSILGNCLSIVNFFQFGFNFDIFSLFCDTYCHCFVIDFSSRLAMPLWRGHALRGSSRSSERQTHTRISLMSKEVSEFHKIKSQKFTILSDVNSFQK